MAGSTRKTQVKVAEKGPSQVAKPAARPVWMRPQPTGNLPEAVKVERDKPQTAPSASITVHSVVPTVAPQLLEQTSPSAGITKPTKTEKPMVTSASKIKSQQQRRSVVEISQDQKSESRNQKSLVGAILLIGFLGLIWIGLNESGFLGSRALVTAAPSPDVIRKKDAEELQKIVDFHRNETGRKLNRERINIEFENQRTAPPIPAGAKIIPEADVMRGVPITSEPFHRQSSRDRTSSETRDFTDTRTQMSLQEEQAAQEAARLQRKQYIDQFIANAAKAGYKVRVEPNGQVKVLGQIPVKDSSFNGTAIPAENRNPAMDGVALPQ